MQNWKLFGLAFGFTLIVGVQPVFSMANCDLGVSERAEVPEVIDIGSQNIFTSSSNTPVLTIQTYTNRVIAGEPASFKIQASVPPRNELSVELFVGIDSAHEAVPDYIEDNYRRATSASRLGTSLEMRLYEGLTVQFPAGQREHQFSFDTMVDFEIGDHAIFMVLNPNTQQNNYEVDNSFDQYYAGAVIIDKQLEFSVSSLPEEAVNKGDCTKFRLSATEESFTHRNVLVRYYGWYGDGTHRDEYVLWVGFHDEIGIRDEIDVISNEPIPEYVSSSGIVVRVIDGLEYDVADAPNNRATIRINGLAPGTIPSDAPIISVAATTTSIVEGQRAHFLIGSEDIPASSNININISVTTTGDFIKNSAPERYTLEEGEYLDNLYIETTDDNLDEENGQITVKILEGSNYWVAPAINRVARMVVEDNDQFVSKPTIDITAITKSVIEGAQTKFVFEVISHNLHESALTINIDVEMIGNYFSSSPAPRTHTLPLGIDFAELVIGTVANNNFEPDGSVRVTILPGNGYFIADSPANTAIAIINDRNDPTKPVIHAQASPSFTEGSRILANDGRDQGPKPIKFGFFADEVTPASQLTVNISIETEGTFNIFHAVDGVTQNNLPTTITFASDEDYIYIDLFVEDDEWYQEDGSITVKINTGTNYYVANKPYNEVTVAIFSDDTLPVVSIAGTQSIEEGASLVVPFTSSGKSVSDTHIHFRIDQNDSDFLIGSTLRTAVLPAKTNSSNFRIVTLDDAEDEAHGNLTIHILNDINNPPTYLVGESSSANIQVSDNDQVVIGIYVENSVKESAERLEFSIAASSPVEVDLPVSVTIESTDAVNNLPRDEIIIIKQGQSSENYVFEFENDEIDEFNETIEISIELNRELNVATDALRRRATVRVVDDDEGPKISVEAAMSEITEGRVAIFKVEANGKSVQDLDIQLQISQNGDFILWRIPSAVKLERLERIVNLKIATKDNTDTSSGGKIEVEILEDTGFGGLTYRVDQDNKMAKIDFEDNDRANAPTSQYSEPRISIASQVADALLRDSQNLIGKIESGDPSQFRSSIAETVYPLVQLPEVSINVINQIINAGESIELIISTSIASVNDLEIKLAVSETGGFINQLPSQFITLESGQINTKLIIPTIDSRQNLPEGVLTIQVKEDGSYIVGSNNEVSVKIIGNLNEIRRREQFSAIYQNLTPELIEHQGTDIFESTLDRTSMAFSDKNSDTNNFESLYAFKRFVKQSGEYLNTSLDSMKNLLTNRSFSLKFFPDDYSIIQPSIWGKSNFQQISDRTTRAENNWNGNLISGQFGVDAKVDDNLLIGAGYSRSDAEVDFDLNQDEELDVLSRTSIVYPYLGLNINEWNARFRATIGYGQMLLRVENSDKITDERTTNLMLTDFSASKQLYSSKGIGENSSKSLAIKGDTSLAKSIDEEGQELGYNTQIGLLSAKLATEGSYKVEFASDSTWNQLISIGAYSQSNNSEQDVGLELKSESRIKYPNGVSLKNEGLLEILNSGSTADWYVGGVVKYNENSESVGMNIGLSGKLEKNRNYGTRSFWNSGNIFNLKDQRSDDVDFSVNSTFGYGIYVFDEGAIVTPFTNMRLTNKNSNQFGVGTRFAISSDLELEFSINHEEESTENFNQNYLLKGKFQW